MAFSLEEAEPAENFEIFPSKAETPSVLHYTSGTTGQPKGVQHVHYSLISQYLTAKWVLDIQDNDIYWCTADPGWVTGTSYGIIGAWSMGVTQCVLDVGFSAENDQEQFARMEAAGATKAGAVNLGTAYYEDKFKGPEDIVIDVGHWQGAAPVDKE